MTIFNLFRLLIESTDVTPPDTFAEPTNMESLLFSLGIINILLLLIILIVLIIIAIQNVNKSKTN